MATSKVVVVSLFLSLLVLFHAQAADQSNEVTRNSVSDSTSSITMDCGGACASRCALSSRPRLCKRACGTCCARCNCVPPGTSGNQDVCPCYANMTTRNNKRKCP
ncbi:snakin-2-like [Cornus florida]|uniref:snakin-2-like n=1 Tax=Cornus florida TaxID=4283 RepID=UPI002897807E|nr:snakin-2-like [Cornus florida]